jgi:hypothetical protein
MRIFYGHPLEAACSEISLANERFVAQRLRRIQLAWLRQRTDRMLDLLEEMNLMAVPRVPESSRRQLMALVADLPFASSVVINEEPSPTEAIDLVFDLQEALLLYMTGTRPDDTDLLENAS